jgi:hypothetical protein
MLKQNQMSILRDPLVPMNSPPIPWFTDESPCSNISSVFKQHDVGNRNINFRVYNGALDFKKVIFRILRKQEISWITEELSTENERLWITKVMLYM